MTRLWIHTAVTVVTTGISLSVVLAQAGQSPAPPATGTGLLAGRVVDARDQAPIAYATVALQPSNAQVLTDGDGRFVFTDLPAGSFTVSAEKPGWIRQTVGSKRPGGPSVSVPLTEGERRPDLLLGLSRYAVISGHVLDEAGEPLVNVDVRLFQETYLAGHRHLAAANRVHTDDRGVYKFWNVTPGDYLVAVPATVMSQPGNFTQTSQFDAAYLQSMSAVGTAQMSTAPATMPAGHGSVVESVFDLPSAPPAEGPWRTYPTTWAPSVQSIGTATVVHAVAGEERSAVEVTMRLVPTYQIAGTLTGPDGPIGLCAVHLLTAESAADPVIDAATAVTDASGAFTFFGVAAGQYVARVVRLPAIPGRDQRYALLGGSDQALRIGIVGLPGPNGPMLPLDPLLYVDHPVTVTNQSVVGLDLVARAGPRIKGHVEFDGTAPHTFADLRNLLISLERADGENDVFALMRGQYTDEADFAMASAWPNRYLLRSGAPKGWTFKGATVNGQDIANTPFDLTGDLTDAVITFTDHPVTVQGSVAADDPKRAPFAVIIFPPDPATWVDFGVTGSRVHLTLASATNTFTMPAPPPGEYCLVAIPDDEADNWQDPAFLAKLLPLADRIAVKDGQPLVHALHVRSLQ